MDCMECGSSDVDTEYLWPRENLDDLECECMECGHKWNLIVDIRRENI
jgi:uncharacterized Zn finger protein